MHGPTTITSPPITAFTVSHTIFCHTRWHHAAPFLSPTNPTEPQSGTTTDAFDIILALLSRIIGLTTASSRTHSLHASATASYSTPRPLSCPVPHDLTSSALLLTQKLASVGHDTTAVIPATQSLFTECLQRLKDFLQNDKPNAGHTAITTPHVPVVEPTAHRPATDLGLDLVGYTFTGKALGRCTVLAPSTYTDEDSIL